MKKISLQFPGMEDYRIVEGINQLKTNIAFSGKDIRKILITSSVSDEGKSVTALRYARVLTENGKKVLFVDADLRNSTLVSKHHIEGVEKGLSHYLSGQAEIEEVIYETPQEGLCLTVAGPLSPDPTALISSNSFEQYMKYADENFDYVIVDAPPLGLVVDAAIIGQYCDGAVVVINHAAVPRKVVQNVIKQLKRSDIRVLGAVLNKIDDRASNDYYNNYHYSYGYGYGEQRDTEKTTK